jgi:hypothetical protein
MLVVLVGQHMRSATGVNKEIAMARNLNVPNFGVYVNGSNSRSTLPTGLGPRSCVPWEWPRIAKMVDQCMKIRKNAG